MLDLPLRYQNFVSAAVFEAEYTTACGTETLWIETRTYVKNMNESQTQILFTIIAGKELRVPSIVDLILHDKECLSLSIPHSVRVEWNNVSKRAVLTEVYVPHHGPKPDRSVKLVLSIDNQIFETELNDVLQDAFEELDELIAPQPYLRVKICYRCNYGYPKLNGPQDERENFQCFRDSSEHLEEVKRLRKFASSEALNSGDFFVNAFHTCAAWEHWQQPDLITTQTPD